MNNLWRSFASFDGTELSYAVQGDGPLVILLHGFAVSSELNWELTGTPSAFAASGYRVCCLDARGHGRSEKPRDPDTYANGALVRDVQALIDHLGDQACALVGYSMGGDTAVRTAAVDDRVCCVVAGGVGGDLADPPDLDREQVARVLLAEVEPYDELSGFLRASVDAMGGERAPLAALFHGIGPQQSPRWSRIDVAVLVVAGTEDLTSGEAAELADLLPHGQSASVPGNHLEAALSPQFLRSATRFVEENFTPTMDT